MLRYYADRDAVHGELLTDDEGSIGSGGIVMSDEELEALAASGAWASPVNVPASEQIRGEAVKRGHKAPRGGGHESWRETHTIDTKIDAYPGERPGVI